MDGTAEGGTSRDEPGQGEAGRSGTPQGATSQGAGRLGAGRLGVVGSGVMAEAIVTRLLASGALSATGVVCADPSEARRREMAERHGVSVSADNREAVRDAAIVLLAVKPQSLAGAAAQLRGSLPVPAVVISIVAGTGSRALQAALAHDRVVRAMPNTPAQVGAGVTVWCATTEVDEEGRGLARALLATLGTEVEVGDERLLGMATAISGSGPAYVLLFMEALVDAGVELGLARDLARTLVVQTLRGSAALAEQPGRHLAELRNLVTSPGGTSAAGLNRLEAGGLRAAVAAAARAAHERALELEARTDRALHGSAGGELP